MMKGWIKTLIFIMLIGLIAILPYKSVLWIEGESFGAMVGTVNEWRQFDYTYLHSVSLTEVVESYEFRDNKIVLVKVVYEDQGAGLPEIIGGDNEFTYKNHQFMVENLSIETTPLSLAVNKAYQYELSNGSVSVNLSSLVTKSSLMTINFKRISLLKYITLGLDYQ